MYMPSHGRKPAEPQRRAGSDPGGTMAVKPIPEGYHTLTPYLVVKGGAAALDFYAKAFGATELYRMAEPSGKVRHAEMRIGDSQFMLADEHPEVFFHPLQRDAFFGDVDPLRAGGDPAHQRQVAAPVAHHFHHKAAPGGHGGLLDLVHRFDDAVEGGVGADA